MPMWLVIGISGVTCGGKTELAQRLKDYFSSHCNSPLWSSRYVVGDVQLIAQDDFFLPVDDARHTRVDELNAINFEILTALDMKCLITNINWTIKRRCVSGDQQQQQHQQQHQHPHYHQQQHQHHHQQQQQQQQQHHRVENGSEYRKEMVVVSSSSSSSSSSASNYEPLYNNSAHCHFYHSHQLQTRPPPPPPHQHQHQHQHLNALHGSGGDSQVVRVNSQAAPPMRNAIVNILIIEGFLIFAQPEILHLCHLKFFFHIPYEKCYERRRKRTYEPPDVIGYFEMCVWPNYEKYFQQLSDRKDIIMLNGDICKQKILNFVLQNIISYVDDRCDTACPPPHKLLGIPTYYKEVVGANNCCPMEQP